MEKINQCANIRLLTDREKQDRERGGREGRLTNK